MDYNTYQSLDLAEVHFSDDKYSHQLFNLYLHLDVNEFAILSKFGHDHDMTYRTSHHVPWGYYTVQFKRYSRKYQSLYYGLFELERKIPHIDYTAIYIDDQYLICIDFKRKADPTDSENIKIISSLKHGHYKCFVSDTQWQVINEYLQSPLTVTKRTLR